MTTPKFSQTPSASQQPNASILPPNSFDFLADLRELLLRVQSDELDAKNVANESNRIRIKIQRARDHVSKLPDVDKSLEEQKQEITRLEEKIAKQRKVLKDAAQLDVVQEAVQRSGRWDA